MTVASAAAEIPRTPSGRPDLSGTYDIKTLTPLERPEGQDGKLTITDEEAASFSNQAAEALAQLNAASDPDRAAPPKGGDGSPGSKGNVGGYNAFWLVVAAEPFGSAANGVPRSLRGRETGASRR